jgi:protein-arginine kinase activator protein McsA
VKRGKNALKCPKCNFPKSKYIERTLEDVKETREHLSRTGATYTTTVTKKKAIYKKGLCPKCKYTWEEKGG